MNDLNAEYVYYDILKVDYDEITEWARNAGYTDDEIRVLHQNAAEMRAKLGYNHSAAFHMIMLAQRPKSTRHFDTTKLGRKRTMWTNLHRRVCIWLGRRDIIFRYLGWDHDRVHRKRRKYQGLKGGQDD